MRVSSLTSRVWSSLDAQQRILKIGDTEVTYHFHPPGSESTIVIFFLGLFAGSWMWASACQCLSDAGFGYAAIDPPYAQVAPSIVNMMNVFDPLVEQIENDFIAANLVLSGNSLGGLAAFDYSSRHKGCIPVIASGIPGLGKIELPGLPMHRMPTQDDARVVAAGIFHNSENITQEMIDEALLCFRNRKYLFNTLRYLAAVKTYPLNRNINIFKGDLSLLWGANDKITPLDLWLKEFPVLFSSARIQLHEIQDCGHSPMIEQANIFNILFMKELRRVLTNLPSFESLV